MAGSHCGMARMLTILSLATPAGLTKVLGPFIVSMARANWPRFTTPGMLQFRVEHCRGPRGQTFGCVFNRFFLCHLLLWHRPWHQHSKVPPIRARYLEVSGPMGVLHSASCLSDNNSLYLAENCRVRQQRKATM